jgi:hypothetical protein
MIYVFVFALLWSAVGASVFFLRADVTSRQRLGLTLVTALLFGVIGWVDVSSIYHTAHTGPAVIAKEVGQAGYRPSKAAD